MVYLEQEEVAIDFARPLVEKRGFAAPKNLRPAIAYCITTFLVGNNELWSSLRCRPLVTHFFAQEELIFESNSVG